MRMDHKLKNQTRNLLAVASLAMAAIICLAPCPGPASAETVLEDGQYWIGRYGANPYNIDPSVEFGELEIAGNTWTHTSQIFPDNRSFSPHDGFDLGMTVIIPKAENPVADDLAGDWVHAFFRTGTHEDGQRFAEANTAEIELDAAGTGTHQADPFDWIVDPDAATMTVTITEDMDEFSFDVGVGDGGMMFRAGWEIGGSDPDGLSMDLFIKIGSDRDKQEAVGRYDVQVLVSDDDLSLWNAYRGILSLNVNNSYHIDFEPDALGEDPDGWSDDGTWSMDGTGCISFQDLEGGSPVSGQLSLAGDVIVAVESGENPGDECSLIVATHTVPEPSVLLLLISAGLVLLFARRK